MEVSSDESMLYYNEEMRIQEESIRSVSTTILGISYKEMTSETSKRTARSDEEICHI